VLGENKKMNKMKPLQVLTLIAAMAATPAFADDEKPVNQDYTEIQPTNQEKVMTLAEAVKEDPDAIVQNTCGEKDTYVFCGDNYIKEIPWLDWTNITLVYLDGTTNQDNVTPEEKHLFNRYRLSPNELGNENRLGDNKIDNNNDALRICLGGISCIDFGFTDDCLDGLFADIDFGASPWERSEKCPREYGDFLRNGERSGASPSKSWEYMTYDEEYSQGGWFGHYPGNERAELNEIYMTFVDIALDLIENGE